MRVKKTDKTENNRYLIDKNGILMQNVRKRFGGQTAEKEQFPLGAGDPADRNRGDVYGIGKEIVCGGVFDK